MTTKNYYRLKLVIYIVAGIALITMLIMFMYSEHGNSSFFNKADNSQYINESFTRAINKINVDIVAYPVFIETHKSNEIIVEINIENSSFKNAIMIELSKDRLKIRQTKRVIYGRATFGTGIVVVKVPANSKYDYDIELVEADMKMYAAGKNVEMDGVNSTIELFTPIEKLTANITSGNASLTADSTSTEFNFESTGADIYISVLHNTGYTITANVKGCPVVDKYNNYRTSSSKASYSHGDGSLTIIVDATAGSVRLGDWQ